MACYSNQRSVEAHPGRWTEQRCFPPFVRLLTWTILLLFALMYIAPCRGWWSSPAVLLAVCYVIDTLLYNTSVAFVTQLPRLPLRTAILGGIAFFELSLAFAVLHLALLKGAMVPELNRLTAWYFSLVTIVTLGYGDIKPKSYGAMVLIMTEIMIGLYFLSTLFTIMVGWANESDTLPTLTTLEENSRELDQEEEATIRC